MLTQGQVGPITYTTSLGSGSQAPTRLGNMGDSIQSELQPRYYENCYRRNIFSVASQAVTTTSLGLATTYTGLCVSNAPGNTVNVVLLKVGFAFTVAFPAAAAVGLACGFNGSTAVTHTTPVTPRSNFIGIGAGPQALADAACTMPTAAVYTNFFGQGDTGAITTIPFNGPNIFDLEGSVILPPGGYAAIVTSTVSGTSGFWGAFSWVEVPL